MKVERMRKDGERPIAFHFLGHVLGNMHLSQLNLLDDAIISCREIFVNGFSQCGRRSDSFHSIMDPMKCEL